MINGYRLMWMMVMFDLPVVSDKDRKAATKFRNFLDKQGFAMCQFSVYARFCGARDRTDSFYRIIEDNLPPKGKISILCFTDKQFGNIVHIENRIKRRSKENPDQLLIFSDD